MEEHKLELMVAEVLRSVLESNPQDEEKVYDPATLDQAFRDAGLYGMTENEHSSSPGTPNDHESEDKDEDYFKYNTAIEREGRPAPSIGSNTLKIV